MNINIETLPGYAAIVDMDGFYLAANNKSNLPLRSKNMMLLNYCQ